jgi:hypothetical protein
MSIPEGWLTRPTTTAEIEAELSEEGVTDLWLRQWRSLVDRLVPGDEPWEYCGEDWVPESQAASSVHDWHDGIALVRGGEVIDWIEMVWR